MKMTIVIDSDDMNGIEDAHKMISIMHTKSVQAASPYNSRSFGKIEFIKGLRRFASSAIDQYENDEEFDLKDMSSLRFTKQFTDSIWKEKER